MKCEITVRTVYCHERQRNVVRVMADCPRCPYTFSLDAPTDRDAAGVLHPTAGEVSTMLRGVKMQAWVHDGELDRVTDDPEVRERLASCACPRGAT